MGFTPERISFDWDFDGKIHRATFQFDEFLGIAWDVAKPLLHPELNGDGGTPGLKRAEGETLICALIAKVVQELVKRNG